MRGCLQPQTVNVCLDLSLRLIQKVNETAIYSWLPALVTAQVPLHLLRPLPHHYYERDTPPRHRHWPPLEYYCRSRWYNVVESGFCGHGACLAGRGLAVVSTKQYNPSGILSDSKPYSLAPSRASRAGSVSILSILRQHILLEGPETSFLFAPCSRTFVPKGWSPWCSNAWSIPQS